MEQDKSSEKLLGEIESLWEGLNRVRRDMEESSDSIPRQEFENIAIKNITQQV